MVEAEAGVTDKVTEEVGGRDEEEEGRGEEEEGRDVEEEGREREERDRVSRSRREASSRLAGEAVWGERARTASVRAEAVSASLGRREEMRLRRRVRAWSTSGVVSMLEGVGPRRCALAGGCDWTESGSVGGRAEAVRVGAEEVRAEGEEEGEEEGLRRRGASGRIPTRDTPYV